MRRFTSSLVLFLVLTLAACSNATAPSDEAEQATVQPKSETCETQGANTKC